MQLYVVDFQPAGHYEQQWLPLWPVGICWHAVADLFLFTVMISQSQGYINTGTDHGENRGINEISEIEMSV